MHIRKPRTLLPGAVSLVLLIALVTCTPDIEAPPGPRDLRVELEPPAFGYQFESQARLIPAHSEAYTCDVVRIEPQDGELLVWLNAFEGRSSQNTHHMNMHAGYFSVGDAFLGEGMGESMLGKEIGQYDCSEFGDLMADQGLQTIYGSQTDYMMGRFPPGVAAPGIVPLVLIMEHHYINTSDEDVLVNAKVNFHRVEEEEVEHVVTAFFRGIDDMVLPPLSRKVEAGTCRITRDVNILLFTTHSHERGQCATLNFYDGETESIDSEPFYVNHDWEAAPLAYYEDIEPLNLIPRKFKAGDGIHWACHYENLENREVKSGALSSDEMCIFVGLAYPNSITVGAVKAMVADPFNTDLDDLDEALVECEPAEDVESPWAVDEVLDGPLACMGLPSLP